MKRVKYVDTYCHGAFHEMFNASLLSLCALAADRVDYIANRHTIDAVMALSDGCLDPDKVSLKRIFVPAGYGRPLPVMVRYMLGAARNMWNVISTPSSVPLIFNYNNAFALRGINWLCSLLRRKVIIFCHGEIELLSSDCKEHMGPIARCLQKRLIAFFVRKESGFASGLRFVVLGDSILDNLKSRISSGAFEKFRAMDHPFLFPDDVSAAIEGSGLRHRKKEGCGLVLGTVGTMKRAKGLDNLHRFLRIVSDSISVKIVGRLEDESIAQMELCGAEVAVRGDTFLFRKELDRRLGELDYILYFYYPDSYRLIASGAIFDAVTARRPVIALRNDFFEYLFRKFGDFGYLEPTPEAMAERVEKLSCGGDPRYTEFMDTIERMRRALHPNGMVSDFTRLSDFTI